MQVRFGAVEMFSTIIDKNIGPGLVHVRKGWQFTYPTGNVDWKENPAQQLVQQDSLLKTRAIS